MIFLKNLKLFKNPISFKLATIFSLLFHILFISLVAVILNFPQFTDVDKTPLFLNFVFEPSENGQDQIANETKNGQKNQKIISNKKQSQAQKSEKDVQKSPEKVNPIAENLSKNTELVSNKNQSENISFENNHFLATSKYSPVLPIETNAIHFPRRVSIQPKLYSAKLPLTKRQEKTVVRNIKKITEKIQEVQSIDSSYVWEHKNQIYEVQLKHLPSSNATEMDELILEITTEENGHTYRTEIKMKRLAFSNFAHFVDFWDPWVAVHDDKIEGRFHTNSEFSISRERGVGPKFNGKVTTAAYNIKHSGTFPIIDQESIFLKGLETGIKTIDLPETSSPLVYDATIDSQQVHYFSSETWISFNKNGSYTYRSNSENGIKDYLATSNKSFFIVGDKDARIHLTGIVKGKVLVFSEIDIIIDDDLIYSQHPKASSLANDYLGIVSQRNVEIAHPSVTGNGDLHIHAAIYAKHRFTIPNRGKNGEATLFIYGSLSAGSLSATEPRYATHVEFDDRLETRRPPNFPMTNLYEIMEWDKRWIIKNPEITSESQY